MTRRAVLAVLAAGAALLAGCATTVTGHGSFGAANSSSGPDFTGQPAPPSQSQSPTQPPSNPPRSSAPPPANPGTLTCPHISYPRARLRFDCITTGMTAADSPIWPLSLDRSVEPSTGWVLEEGAGHWGAPQGHSLAQITAQMRQAMVDDGGYGDSPKVTTVADKDTTVGGAKAHLLQSTMTINPAWAAKQKTKVKQEHLWVVAVQVGANDVSLWYTSIPDLASNLWPKVPTVINTIHVG